MALDELKDNDHVEDYGSFKAIMEEELADNFPQIKLDYVDDSRGKGFSISTGMNNCGDGCSC